MTEAFLALTAALLGAGFVDSTTRAYVAFTLAWALPRHRRWRYADGAQRWRVGAAATRVLRLALAAPPSSAPSAATDEGAQPAATRGNQDRWLRVPTPCAGL